MERDVVTVVVVVSSLDFNSHAHVERDTGYVAADDIIIISTHTLTWSVTAIRENISIYRPISTHTLTWSVTI